MSTPTTPTTAERIARKLCDRGLLNTDQCSCAEQDAAVINKAQMLIQEELERERQQVRGALKQCHDALTDGRIGTTEMDHPRFYEKLDRAALAAQAALAMLEPSKEGK